MHESLCCRDLHLAVSQRKEALYHNVISMKHLLGTVDDRWWGVSDPPGMG